MKDQLNAWIAPPNWFSEANYPHIIGAAVGRILFLIHDVLASISKTLAETVVPASRFDMPVEEVEGYQEPTLTDSKLGFGYPVDVYEQRQAWKDTKRDSLFEAALSTKIGQDTLSFEISLEGSAGAGVGTAVSNAGAGAAGTAGATIQISADPSGSA